MLIHVARKWLLLNHLPLRPHPHVRHPLGLSARLYGHNRHNYHLESRPPTHGHAYCPNNRHLPAVAIQFTDPLPDQRTRLPPRYRTQIRRIEPGLEHGTY